MKNHGLTKVDYEADYLWECKCGEAGEDLHERDKHLATVTQALLKAHTPSVTSEMDAGEGEWEGVGPRDDIGDYVGDQRICACGRRIDGFYDFVDHLKEVLA